MKFSEQWLRQLVTLPFHTTELTEKMAMLGLTVDAVTPVAGKFSGVVVGEVITCVKHPNAEKLSCCEVSVGEEPLLKIVCGASNVRAGLKVAVAKIGAILPGDFKIKEAKLRGELSQGMLCSAKELALVLGKSLQDGILELPADAKIGEDFNDYFKTNDCIIDVDITPNRADALSIRGVARDLAAAMHLPLKSAPIKTIAPVSNDTLPIQVDATNNCPRYVGRSIRGVNNTLQTPLFIQQALQRANIRLISPVVDITNYVMLELGQPMHAYDLSTINQKIIVRHAKNQEKIKLLDEQEITLTDHDLIIADTEKPLALAGIMGGMESGVSATTTDILLEAAFFTPKNICLSKRRHNVSSDSSHRFERGVDFELPMVAMERATQLIMESTGGKPANSVDVVSKEALPKREAIFLARHQIERMLGISIADERVVRILQSLEMSVTALGNGWDVIPPSFRFDIQLPIDLIEELARIEDYQTIPASHMIAPLMMKSVRESTLHLQSIRHFLTARDYHETISYSFISPELHALFAKEHAPLSIKNPLSQEMSIMRTSLLPGLLQAVKMNLNYQCERLRFFETGMCFLNDNGLQQINKLGIAITGNTVDEQWGEKKRSVDFYDLKKDIEVLLNFSDLSFCEKSGKVDFLHPERSCILRKDGKSIGVLGEIHPQILTHFDIKQPVIVCEVTLDALQNITVAPRYHAFSRFPFVRRDLAIVLDEAISAAELEKRIRKTAGSLLVDLHVFDVYQGKNIELGKKSIALGLTFQDSSRTLRDEEINEKIQVIVAMLAQELNARLR